MKRDGDDRMFPFIKRDISEWDSGYEPKIINWGLIKLAGNPMSIKHPKATVLLLLVQLGADKVLFNVYIYLLLNFLEIKMSGAVDPCMYHTCMHYI